MPGVIDSLTVQNDLRRLQWEERLLIARLCEKGFGIWSALTWEALDVSWRFYFSLTARISYNLLENRSKVV